MFSWVPMSKSFHYDKDFVKIFQLYIFPWQIIKNCGVNRNATKISGDNFSIKSLGHESKCVKYEFKHCYLKLQRYLQQINIAESCETFAVYMFDCIAVEEPTNEWK